MIFLEPLTTRNSKQRNMKRHRGASLKHQPPARASEFCGSHVHSSRSRDKTRRELNLAAGLFSVRGRWYCPGVQSLPGLCLLPGTVTGVSLGKLLNLNTRDVSPCEPQDHSSTSLTGSVDPTVNACGSQQQVCAGVGASSLVVLISSSRRGMRAGPGLACLLDFQIRLHPFIIIVGSLFFGPSNFHVLGFSQWCLVRE